MFVRTFEVHQVADNLKGNADKNVELVLGDTINTSSSVIETLSDSRKQM